MVSKPSSTVPSQLSSMPLQISVPASPGMHTDVPPSTHDAVVRWQDDFVQPGFHAALTGGALTITNFHTLATNRFYFAGVLDDATSLAATGAFPGSGETVARPSGSVMVVETVGRGARLPSRSAIELMMTTPTTTSAPMAVDRRMAQVAWYTVVAIE